jgi:hypothetical protein
LVIGDDLKKRDQAEPFLLGCEREFDARGGSMYMSDAGVQFEEASAYAKANGSESSEGHWMIELDQEAFDADVSGVAEQHSFTGEELDRKAEVDSGIAISKGLNHGEWYPTKGYAGRGGARIHLPGYSACSEVR